MQHRYLLSILLLVLSFRLQAQRKETDIADVYYDYFRFEEALTHYQNALDETKEDKAKTYLIRQMAHCYQYLFKYVDSEKYYAQLVTTFEDVKPEDYVEYGVMLKMNGKYEEARKQFSKFQQAVAGNDPYASFQIRSVNWAIKNKDLVNPVGIFPTDLDISGQCVGYALYDNGIIYGNAGNKPPLGALPVFDLDYAELKDSVHFVKGPPLMAKIIFETNEGAPCTTSNGELLYFNANATKIKDGKVKKFGSIQISKEGVSNFKIYVSQYSNGEFINVQELPFNNNNYNCVHPFISDDAQTLYFASDMPGGYGGLDLYLVRRNSDGTWGTPNNLGSAVNSEENELFPFIHNNRFYFSSKGMNGYGGYDVYTAVLSQHGMPSAAQNMGQPVNSFRDELGFVTYANGRYGYVSSNRDNNEGKDKLYFFHDYSLDPITPPEPKRDSVIAAAAPPPSPSSSSSSPSSSPAPALALTPTLTPTPSSAPAPNLTSKAPALPRASSSPSSSSSSPSSPSSPSAPESEESLLRKTFRHVQFKLNQYKLSADYHITLDSVISASHQNKNLVVQVNAYTDATGSSNYNQQLSERRAQAVKRYLIARGVPASRIRANGYGETQLLNHCADGTNCSAAEHAVNRRVEIRFIR